MKKSDYIMKSNKIVIFNKVHYKLKKGNKATKLPAGLIRQLEKSGMVDKSGVKDE